MLCCTKCIKNPAQIARIKKVQVQSQHILACELFLGHQTPTQIARFEKMQVQGNSLKLHGCAKCIETYLRSRESRKWQCMTTHSSCSVQTNASSPSCLSENHSTIVTLPVHIQSQNPLEASTINMNLMNMNLNQRHHGRSRSQTQ